MASGKHARSKPPAPAQSEVAAAEVLAWLSDCIESGLCFVSNGILIFENAQFGELSEAASGSNLHDPAHSAQERGDSLRTRLFADAKAWNAQPLGARRTETYRLTDRHEHPLIYECR
ncbi:MAG: hypothetical protein HC801_08255, partial [Nitrospira sp.]|nr:hypothetical protein [Nitrospira sp.]